LTKKLAGLGGMVDRAVAGIATDLRYVVVEGPIGVGKTSLVKKLAATYGSDVLLEKPEENPFLERFYNDPEAYALPTQLFFLFQRSRQVEVLKQSDMFRSSIVSDFMIDKDQLFARVNLQPDEFRLYEQVYAQLSIELPTPDLVIYLQAPVDVLMDRIYRRGIDYEQRVERQYLARLVESYTDYFYHYRAAPLLMVNASEVNFVDNDSDFHMLLEYIDKTRSGRHFFNPLSSEA